MVDGVLGAVDLLEGPEVVGGQGLVARSGDRLTVGVHVHQRNPWVLGDTVEGKIIGGASLFVGDDVLSFDDVGGVGDVHPVGASNGIDGIEGHVSVWIEGLAFEIQGGTGHGLLDEGGCPTLEGVAVLGAVRRRCGSGQGDAGMPGGLGQRYGVADTRAGVEGHGVELVVLKLYHHGDILVRHHEATGGSVNLGHLVGIGGVVIERTHMMVGLGGHGKRYGGEVACRRGFGYHGSVFAYDQVHIVVFADVVVAAGIDVFDVAFLADETHHVIDMLGIDTAYEAVEAVLQLKRLAALSDGHHGVGIHAVGPGDFL